jgi:DNA mismatch repair protein MutS2
MSGIIREADDNTLLLIDEFGTGSDPELGGALAESFLEFFYEKIFRDYYHALHQH